ncbi:Acetyltransferase [Pseudomonas coronafaciens pv. atropurpurea]|nr:Acetyltransferase [Pseudomonas coronafaciens pv. atropurpurea]RMT57424.1 Acetyltransferase [Pseudomonas coronafaciens pv. atropurpurea]
MDLLFKTLGLRDIYPVNGAKRMSLIRKTEPDIILTTVHPGDFDALVAMRIEAMRDSLERIGRFDPVRARERFREGFSAPDTRHIEVAESRVGFVVLKALADSLLLDHLYIKPGAQGQGIGSAVLRQVFAEADAMASALRVGALKESDSNRFYIRHGFQLVGSGEFDNYYVRPQRLPSR